MTTMPANSRRRPKLDMKRLGEMVEEATVDCYDESDQVTGLYTMIEDNLKLPFQTGVLGVEAVVERVELNDREEIVAICRRGKERISVPILDLPPPEPPPGGWEWIDAYRHWLVA